MAIRDDLPVEPFTSRGDWEAWLTAHGGSSPGLWLKFAKKGCVTPSVTKAEAIEAALCHGWIDGQLQPFDADWFLTRFTPRGRTSKWSEVNRTTALRLIADNRMAPAGLAVIDRAKATGRWDTAYAPQSTAAVPADLQDALDASSAAQALFNRLDGTNRYAILHRTQTAASLRTRAARIEKFVAMLARGETIYPLKSKA